MYIYIYAWHPLSPGRWGGSGFIFQDQWGAFLFIWTLGGLLHMGHMGGVTIRDFPGGNSSTNFWPNWQMQSIKVNLTKYHRKVYRIKFYQIVTSDVLTSL